MPSCLEGSEIRKLEVLLYLLKEGPASVSQVAQEFKLKEDTARSILSELKKKGVVENLGDVYEANYSSPIVSILAATISELLGC